MQKIYVWPDRSWMYSDEYIEHEDSWRGDDYMIEFMPEWWGDVEVEWEIDNNLFRGK